MARASGFDKLQRELDQFAKAAKALDGDIVELKFNASSADSVETAVAEMRAAVQARVSPYLGSKMVQKMVAEVIANYEQKILERASESRISREEDIMTSVEGDEKQDTLRQIENVVSDLRRSEANTFDRHIKKLSRLLHTDELDEISNELIAGVDLDAWLAEGNESQGSMMGSATLSWPERNSEELGLVAGLIDKFAKTPDEAATFSHTFYYNGNNISRNLQNMVSQMIVPFARDFIDHVKAKTGVIEATTVGRSAAKPAARKVFIVHGRDEGPREAVARFLEKLQFEAVILHERANQGRTIIEKIEAHGDVGFAVVLLTPDDEGKFKGETPRPRPRQNVLLELGYFIGLLGRSRVCALKSGEMEVPSDFGGVVYTAYDASRGWQQELARELQAAGFEIDWNKIMGSR
ncbi:nucleotide-binding protein [Bosea sp. AS-1]|uniref:TIR domain-containing protein n=1 Tax=Bosea sp. AS-1 TaxID=2015316 RepID=UPI0020C069DE|nr:nucleotide-binding protein [Bosea sp. AS-1]